MNKINNWLRGLIEYISSNKSNIPVTLSSDDYIIIYKNKSGAGQDIKVIKITDIINLLSNTGLEFNKDIIMSKLTSHILVADQFGTDRLVIKEIPTSSEGLGYGEVWSDSGTLKIV